MAQSAATLESGMQDAGSLGNGEDLALIEHQVDSGLLELLHQYEPVEKLSNLPLDLLNERFTIDLSTPLPQFDSGAAKAYAAEDLLTSQSSLIALVCAPETPYRQPAVDALKNSAHPGIMSLREAGIVKLSSTKEIRQVLFVDRPSGTVLSDIIASGRQLHERAIIDQILSPIIGALSMAAERDVSHGIINSDNIFIGEKAVLRECVSEPQGLSQQMIFEPIERLIADPMARGAATQKTDAYALGMLVFDIMFGLERFKKLSRAQLTQLLLEKGAYHTFIASREVSETFSDFFRGTLTESKQERWGIDQLRAWLAGKRFNLIMPSIPKEATRAFHFHEKDYFNTRALAQGIYANWPTASKQIRSANLDRWLEMSAHQSEKGDLVSRTIENFGGEVGGTDKVNNDMLSRLILTLDPGSPIRFKAMALNVDGIGLALLHLFKARELSKIELLRTIIDTELPNFWSENSDDLPKTQLTTNTMWRLSNIRSIMKLRSHGFGLERMIYDLNPNLICQSHWLLPYHASSIAETLNILDNIAKARAEDTSLADKELAAFLASKVDMTKEVRFNQLEKVPKLRNHPELTVLRIISMAQDKNQRKKMVGLATWAAIRIDKLLEEVHSRKLRNSIRAKLMVAAKTGLVSRVLAVMVENESTKEDHQGFMRAHSVFLRNSAKIAALENREKIDQMSKDFGGRIAVFIAYVVLLASFYSVIDTYLY